MNDRINDSSGTDDKSDVSGGKSNRRSWWRFPRSWKDVKSLGWKFVLAFILFYLIRDSILYILIPYLLYKGIISV